MGEESDTFVPSRFKEERERLKANQSEVADWCAVAVKTVRRWEQGTPIPSDKLAVLASHGADVQYILTGKRAAPGRPVAVDHQLLTLVIEAVEEGLEEAELEMAPAKKAELVVALYDLYADTGKEVDKAKVLRLIRTAA